MNKFYLMLVKESLNNEDVAKLAKDNVRDCHEIEQAFKGLERLRNNLAHSQDIISSDWEIIVQLSENLDQVLEGPPGLADLD